MEQRPLPFQEEKMRSLSLENSYGSENNCFPFFLPTRITFCQPLTVDQRGIQSIAGLLISFLGTWAM